MILTSEQIKSAVSGAVRYGEKDGIYIVLPFHKGAGRAVFCGVQKRQYVRRVRNNGF